MQVKFTTTLGKGMKIWREIRGERSKGESFRRKISGREGREKVKEKCNGREVKESFGRKIRGERNKGWKLYRRRKEEEEVERPLASLNNIRQASI